MKIPLLEMFAQWPMETQLLVLAGLFIPFLANFAAIWHVFQRRFPSPQEKLIWLGLGLFMPFLGGLPYWLFGARRGERMAAPSVTGDTETKTASTND